MTPEKTDNPYIADVREIAQRRRFKVVIMLALDEWDRICGVTYGDNAHNAQEAVKMMRHVMDSLGIKGPETHEHRPGEN